ncbi:[acyl-carrier-protein] S-malonyltransferase [Coxiella endosymbiont of Amblyomma sculptum]|uniref:ACP S-malonyltransferase n=1 Tax=Coxiella endosymbiont of Amblyomma sculptum TaxID=2487929 RepID=UPI00132F492A|nr:ACP S-malonyltransferase [Coxiella endosymbiont of Amblyomma sculptum]QHG92644.1 [acyl-carrier-protein] S-malonyltransferase [Coxiella endosymbiont of Amblyomma sculptum]
MPQPFALIFPGQGSQHLGMLRELAKEQVVVRETFCEASSALGYDLWLLTQTGPREKLDQTQYTQPALLAAGVAVFRCWEILGGPLPKVMAGHSLGEYTALVCAEALQFTDAIRLVKNRGRYMQEAVPIEEGAMGVIIGLSELQIRAICKESSQNSVVSPANLNSPVQIVISGEVSAVNRALVSARIQGAKIAKRIPVSVPSHSSLMNPAAKRFSYDLAKTSITSPKIPVIHNVDTSEHYRIEAIRHALIKQLVSPVRWVETIQKMVRQGIKFFGECGVGHTLLDLNKRIECQSKTFPLTVTKLILSAIKLVK